MIEIGQKIPELELTVHTTDGAAKKPSGAFFSGKKIALIAMPGAFTGTCTLNHLPGYIENADALKGKGIDEILVLTVNDPFVVEAWAKQSGGEDKITFVADWDAAFTKAIGMDIDLSAAGLGVRSKRYAMIVDNGEVQNIEVEESPGQAEASGAAKMLEQL